MYPKGNTFIPASHGRLEAVLREPRGGLRGAAAVCHPHPLGGGTMHTKVVYRAAQGLLEAGLATIRFNFRGVGASTGTHDDGIGEKQDVADVLDFLADRFPGQPLTLAGFSFGSRFGIEQAFADPRVVRLISIGTPVDKYDYSFLAGLRKPILFIHGDRDEFGPLDKLNELVAVVSETSDAELVVFPDCGHFFEDHLIQLKNVVHDWVLEKIAQHALATGQAMRSDSNL